MNYSGNQSWGKEKLFLLVPTINSIIKEMRQTQRFFLRCCRLQSSEEGLLPLRVQMHVRSIFLILPIIPTIYYQYITNISPIYHQYIANILPIYHQARRWMAIGYPSKFRPYKELECQEPEQESNPLDQRLEPGDWEMYSDATPLWRQVNLIRIRWWWRTRGSFLVVKRTNQK